MYDAVSIVLHPFHLKVYVEPLLVPIPGRLSPTIVPFLTRGSSSLLEK